MFRHPLTLLLFVALSACAPLLQQPPESSVPSELGTAQPMPPDAQPELPAAPPASTPPAAARQPALTAPTLVAVAWADLPSWAHDDHAAALKAFVTGCTAMGARETWRRVCEAARKVAPNRVGLARRFFESHFQPLRVASVDGHTEGLITGYYEPLLNGSRQRTARYRFPLYAVPDDLLSIDLAELHPDLKGLRLRGRIDGRRVVPYYTRAEIDAGNAARNTAVLFWVDDPIDLFFLQIQGSGQIRLDNGSRARVGYADQNGHPYRSIGRLLIERGELTLEKASMQGIKAWARQNPDKLADVLNHNARYIFFREFPTDSPGPIGALGVPLSAGRSLAVDPSFVPLGAPVFLDTTWPNAKQTLQRLMMAQDTGSAIRGAVRADFYWGFGEQAGTQAGRMRQPGRMWVLAPNGIAPESLLAR